MDVSLKADIMRLKGSTMAMGLKSYTQKRLTTTRKVAVTTGKKKLACLLLPLDVSCCVAYDSNPSGEPSYELPV